MFEDNQECLDGQLDTIIYQNAENFYTIGGLVMGDDTKEIIVGTMPYVVEGDYLTVYGRYVMNPKYGRQFQVNTFEKRLPTKKNDILQYLSTGAVKGIGPKLAAKIVARFGEDAFDVIENHPTWLSEVPGISQKNADAISKRFIEAAGARQVLMYCKDYFSPATALAIYKRWGKDAISHLQGNPYLLCDQYYKISFQTADKFGRARGIEDDNINRVKAGILYTLGDQAERCGHTCFPDIELVHLCNNLLGSNVSEMKILSAMEELRLEGRLHDLILGNDKYWFRHEYYEAETYIARKMLQLQRLCPSLTTDDSARLILEAEEISGITYSTEQRTALLTALKEGVMILTGGPGTGKTTIIKGLVNIFEKLDFTVSLAAPTGRAAKRMSEATSHEAKTIHRLLELEIKEHGEPTFYRCEKQPLESQVIIVDEASMIDVVLMSSLLRAIRPGSHLIIIGDAHQLPSVGAGNLLSDLLSYGQFPTVFLQEIYRQSEDSRIIFNAHEIEEGRVPDLTIKSKDFFFLRRNETEDIAETVIDLVQNRLPKVYGEDIKNQIQVITPSHRGPAGTISLNYHLQDAVNPGTAEKKEKFLRTRSFRDGDKIIQIKNNYELQWESDSGEGEGVFNGDIGYIEKVCNDTEELILRFDDRKVNYDYMYLDELELAYAITVHKSQGSEYPVVIIPLYACPPLLQTRNLLYTAITRASKMVILVGRTEVFEHMIANDRHDWRSTSLVHFLKKVSL